MFTQFKGYVTMTQYYDHILWQRQVRQLVTTITSWRLLCQAQCVINDGDWPPFLP